MYDFQKQRRNIIESAKNYGITVKLVDNGSMHGVLELSGYAGSESVERSIRRKMETYNTHSRKGR